MTPKEKDDLVERMSRMYLGMSRYQRESVAKNFNAPAVNPKTGKAFQTFKEILETLPEGEFEKLVGDFNTTEKGTDPETPQ